MAKKLNTVGLEKEINSLKDKLNKTKQELTTANNKLKAQKKLFKDALTNKVAEVQHQAREKAQQNMKKLLAARNQVIADAVSKFEKQHMTAAKKPAKTVTAKKPTKKNTTKTKVTADKSA